MPQTKQQKEALIKELAEKLKVSKSVVFSDYKGLQVKDMTLLRRELRASGVELKVLKKTLINLAMKKAGIEADSGWFEKMDQLPGLFMARYADRPEFEEGHFRAGE